MSTWFALERAGEARKRERLTCKPLPLRPKPMRPLRDAWLISVPELYARLVVVGDWPYPHAIVANR